MCKCGRVQVSGGFWILLGWFALVNGSWLTIMVLLAAASHECGHLLVLHCQGVLVNSAYITVFGAEIEADMHRLSYGGTLLCLLAGVAVNALCAVALMWVDAPWATVFAGVHIALCVVNLLPVRPLDGGRGLEAVLRWRFGPMVSEQVTTWIERSVALVIGCGLVWLIWATGGSLWLAPGAVAFLMIAIQKS